MTATSFLAPLEKLILRHPRIEAQVSWRMNDRWTDPATEVLEPEEIVFYTDGLLAEGFSAAWQHLLGAAGDQHIRLLFWQGGSPALPELPQGRSLAAQGLALA